MDTRINFSGRSIKYTEEEIACVVKAMRDAEPLTQGRYMREFEAKFATYQGVAEGSCFTTCNGCAALEMSAQLCCFKPGDEFVIPSHTFTASCYPYIKHGGKPVFADIDLNTRVVTAESIAKVLTKKTKAVIVVHLYGFAADMPPIVKLCQERGLILIEDTAQAIGSTLNGQKAGSFGDHAIFSFHSHKNLTTLGEGGMLYVADPKLWPLIPPLRHNGHCSYDTQPVYWKPAMGNVDLPYLDNTPLLPNNYSLGEIECALGAKMLERIDKINAEKRARALDFIDNLSDLPQLEFHREATSRHNYHLLACRVTGGEELRDRIMQHLFKDYGIKCVVQYLPLNRYPFYQRLGFGLVNCPNADLFFDTMISFPFQHWLSQEDFNYMLESTRKVVQEYA